MQANSGHGLSPPPPPLLSLSRSLFPYPLCRSHSQRSISGYASIRWYGKQNVGGITAWGKKSMAKKEKKRECANRAALRQSNLSPSLRNNVIRIIIAFRKKRAEISLTGIIKIRRKFDANEERRNEEVTKKRWRNSEARRNY